MSTERLIVFSEGPLAGAWRAVDGKATKLCAVPASDYFFSGASSGKVRSGPGVEKWPAASYVGSFENNERSGEGVLSFRDGGYYSGGFQKGRFHGTGTLTLPKLVISGTWFEGQPHGACTLTTPKVTYTGNFAHGKRSGFGVAKYSDGTQYSGQWLDGQRHGRGTMLLASGAVDGVWVHDTLSALGDEPEEEESVPAAAAADPEDPSPSLDAAQPPTTPPHASQAADGGTPPAVPLSRPVSGVHASRPPSSPAPRSPAPHSPAPRSPAPQSPGPRSPVPRESPERTDAGSEHANGIAEGSAAKETLDAVPEVSVVE